VTEPQCEGQDKRETPKTLRGLSIVNDKFTTLGSNPRKPSYQNKTPPPPPPQDELLPPKQWTLALSHRSFKPRRRIVSVRTISVRKYISLSDTEHSDDVNGRKGYRSRDVNMRFGASVLPQIYGWLVGWLVGWLLWGCILSSRCEGYGSERK